MKEIIFFIILILLITSQVSAKEIVATYNDSYLQTVETSYGKIYIVHLKGTHYQMGNQYGYLLNQFIIDSFNKYKDNIEKKFNISGNIFDYMMNRTWKYLEEHIPNKYHQEIKGIVDGAKKKGIEIKPELLQAVIALTNYSDVYDKLGIFSKFYPQCSSFAVWGNRTKEKEVISSWNFDWETDTGICDYKLITVYEPYREDGTPLNKYITIGYIGLIGALTGMNEYGITVAQIGAHNTVETLDGMPWTIRFREILENATNLEEAIDIVKTTTNTYGQNYIITDGRGKKACAIEVNAKYTEVFFDNDERERKAIFIDKFGNKFCYGLPLKEAVFRADTALSQSIRSTQVADNGPGIATNSGDPREGDSYNLRYKKQYEMIKEYEEKGIKIGIDEALNIVRAVAMEDANIISIVYNNSKLEFYVAYEIKKDGIWIRASENEYYKFSFRELIKKN